MSKTTVSSLTHLSSSSLAKALLSPSESKPTIIDVRDADYIGGHIKGSLHVPSSNLDALLPELVRTLSDAQTVVFHCMLSQQRGPSAALRYARAREAAGREGGQVVAVLDGGFQGWQAVYGADERLTEGWDRELWEDGI